MTVYIDNFYNVDGRQWSHMWSPNIDELHSMAHKIGLKRSWFQDHPRHPHYDICSKTIRDKAIAEGAVEVSSKELIKFIRDHHD